jgi:hypothetical protein
MNPRINQLVKSLLQKDSLEQCSLPELQQFAERHPYFGAAQLLLTKKMQTERPELYEEQLKKTYLFFHNPFWVEHMLNDTGSADIIKTKIVSTPEANVSTAKIKNEEKEDVIINDVHTSGETESSTENNTTGNNGPDTVIPVTDTSQPATGGNEELLFEPFHTVDYFASQGIRFKEEEQPKDKFGQQLKSFTDWLKTMKRLTPSQVAQQSEPISEKKVEQMAETSLQEREVITEAMAAVWEKQGNKEKAIEVYSKLSLLEPSKSVYFAAKIEELKKLI